MRSLYTKKTATAAIKEATSYDEILYIIENTGDIDVINVSAALNRMMDTPNKDDKIAFFDTMLTFLDTLSVNNIIEFCSITSCLIKVMQMKQNMFDDKCFFIIMRFKDEVHTLPKSIDLDDFKHVDKVFDVIKRANLKDYHAGMYVPHPVNYKVCYILLQVLMCKIKGKRKSVCLLEHLPLFKVIDILETCIKNDIHSEEIRIINNFLIKNIDNLSKKECEIITKITKHYKDTCKKYTLSYDPYESEIKLNTLVTKRL